MWIFRHHMQLIDGAMKPWQLGEWQKDSHKNCQEKLVSPIGLQLSALVTHPKDEFPTFRS